MALAHEDTFPWYLERYVQLHSQHSPSGGEQPHLDFADSFGCPEVLECRTLDLSTRTGEILWRWASFEHLTIEETPLNPHFAREHWPMANTVNERVTSDPKTRAGKRTVYLPDCMLSELRRHPQWSAEKEPDDLPLRR